MPKSNNGYSRSPMNEKEENLPATRRELLHQKQQSLRYYKALPLDSQTSMVWYKIFLKDDETPIYRKGSSIKRASGKLLPRVKSYDVTTKLPREIKDVHHKWSDGHLSKLPHKCDFARLCREHILNGEKKFIIAAGSSTWRLKLTQEKPSYFVVTDDV